MGVVHKMQFTKRRADSKSKVLPTNFDEIKEQCLLDIRSLVVMKDILINWDQTAMKIPYSSKFL